MLLGLSSALAAPSDAPAWIPLVREGAAYGDPEGDAASDVDLSAGGWGTTGWWSADDTALYFRMALAEPPGGADGNGTDVGARGFGWFFDLDDTPATLDLLVQARESQMVYAEADGVEGGYPSWTYRGATLDLRNCDCTAVTSDSATGEDTGEDTVWYFDVSLAWMEVPASLAEFGVMPYTRPTENIGGAVADHLGETEWDVSVEGVWPDRVALDADGDGIFTPLEVAHGLDPEARDTDGGGLDDGEEDLDHDGAVGPWETDPLDAHDDADGDEDDLPDAVEARCTLAGTAEDRDGDTLGDEDEGRDDTDGDGAPDFCDEDDDGDGLLSSVEGDADSDGDGAPDAYDTDADDDGVLDGAEGTSDVDCDEVPAFQDAVATDGPCADPDDDGLDNATEAACGSNPTGVDSDRDGVEDAAEACDQDEDCDHLPDRIDGSHDEGFCGVIDQGSDTACVDADPDDPWHDCPGLVAGGAGCAGGCASRPSPGRALASAVPLLLAVVSLRGLALRRPRSS